MLKKLTLVLMLVTASACGAPSKKSVLEKLDEKMLDSSNPLVLMRTNKGDVYLELYAKAAPKTVENFLQLAAGTKEFTDPKTGTSKKAPYYDGLIFHRVIPNFMIQGGDIKGDGTGGPGYRFEDEISATALGLDTKTVDELPYYGNEVQNMARQIIFEKLNIKSQADLNQKQAQANQMFKVEIDKLRKKSVMEILQSIGYQFQNQLPSVEARKFNLAMANSGPNTNGSQFFINVTDTPHLNGKHTVFGKAVGGQNVILQISEAERDARDKPKENIIIEKMILLQD
ncbi:MAG: peptidylprolyl isomerase [Leptospiraceae bacterium]|nr:peptidylprolyl isomerase [Leptospiraceae bacterium]